MPHMGKLVKKVAAEKGLNATTLSALLDNRPAPGSVSRLFGRPFFHTVILFRLRRALDYDFFAHLCRCPKEDTEAVKGEAVKLEGQIKELEKENEGLKKENGMLQKMVRLLEKKDYDR